MTEEISKVVIAVLATPVEMSEKEGNRFDEAEIAGGEGAGLEPGDTLEGVVGRDEFGCWQILFDYVLEHEDRFAIEAVA